MKYINYLISSSKVGQTLGTVTKEVSPIIIQNSGQVYDDVTLGALNQANNFAPNLTSRYLNNPTSLTNITNDFVSSYFPGIPESNKAGFAGWSAAAAFYWEDTVDTVRKDVELIKSIPSYIEQFINTKKDNNDK